MLPVALTIAGSDPSGGAGLQADLKTFCAFRVYGATVVTAITVQNSIGLRHVEPIAPGLVVAQLEAVLEDLPVAAIKTGLLVSSAQVHALAATLRTRPGVPLIVDPVLVAGSGDRLADSGIVSTLLAELLPLATLLTPNLDEAEALCGFPVRDLPGMHRAAAALVARGARGVLVKGGHLPGEPCDVLQLGATIQEFPTRRIGSGRRHGTGCTLSAAIAAALSAGDTLPVAVARAHAFVQAALDHTDTPGQGARPLDHLVHPKDG